MNDQVFGREYADQYDLLYSDKDYEAECDLLEEIFRRYGDRNIRTILDLGCGTGNHAIRLGCRDYQVTGVDRSPEMLTQARRKAAELRQSWMCNVPTFLEGDVRSVDLSQTFDAVLMMFAVLSYQLTNNDVLAALRTVRRHLRSGGLFVADVWYGPAVLAIRPNDRVKVVSTPSGELIRAASGWLDVRHHLCKVNFRLWRVEGDRVVSTASESHCMRYFFPMELELFLTLAEMRLNALLAFPEINQEASEHSWNVLVVGKHKQG